MRERPAARLLVIDEQQRVLLFRFFFKHGALGGTVFWATPGGEVDPGESFEAAAKRELFEETGIIIGTVDQPVDERQFELLLPDGTTVKAHEKYYVVKLDNRSLATENWTKEEIETITEHRWWHEKDLRSATEKVYPENLADLLVKVL